MLRTMPNCIQHSYSPCVVQLCQKGSFPKRAAVHSIYRRCARNCIDSCGGATNRQEHPNPDKNKDPIWVVFERTKHPVTLFCRVRCRRWFYTRQVKLEPLSNPPKTSQNKLKGSQSFGPVQLTCGVSTTVSLRWGEVDRSSTNWET